MMKSESTSLKTNEAKSQIVGFRLPPALAREVKTEAARRGLKLNALFEELWESYVRSARKEQ